MTSVLNKNSLLYGAHEVEGKKIGSSCGEMRGEKTHKQSVKPEEAPIKAAREK